MQRRLDALEQSAQEHLRRLQDPSADREVILRLLETSCLLELSKLTAAQVDLATFVQTTVGVLVQFFPVDSCVLVIEPEGLPRARAVFGSPPVDDERLPALAEAGGDDPLVLKVSALAQPIGHLMVAGLPSFISDPSFFTTAADQLSAVLGAMVAAERLRRQAAQANAQQLAATIDQGADDEQLQSLVDALAALPGASGAVLTVDHPAVGVPTEVTAGIAEADSFECTGGTDAGGATVRLYTNGDRSAEEPLQQVLDVLVGTLDRMHHERVLLEQVETDPLTGAGNRRRAGRSLASALARAERTGDHVAVLAFDLDHFKLVNDNLGHHVGDEVLQRFTRMMVDQVRAYDTVARMGGEEFNIVCPGLDLLEARAVAERIVTATPDACAPPLQGGYRQTVSCGVAVYPNHAEFPDGLLRKADAALYEAKRMGHNRVAVAESSAPAVPPGRRLG
jgi:diguanylate cyclase (GGDEF)-like protein